MDNSMFVITDRSFGLNLKHPTVCKRFKEIVDMCAELDNEEDWGYGISGDAVTLHGEHTEKQIQEVLELAWEMMLEESLSSSSVVSKDGKLFLEFTLNTPNMVEELQKWIDQECIEIPSGLSKEEMRELIIKFAEDSENEIKN